MVVSTYHLLHLLLPICQPSVQEVSLVLPKYAR